MNIMVACDSNYVKYLLVLMESVFANHNDKQVVFYVLHYRLNDEDIKVITDFAKSRGQRAEICKVSNDEAYKLQQYFKLPRHLKAIETYFRLLWWNLPKELDRILWLDLDIAIDGDISDFYNLDFEDNYLIAFHFFKVCIKKTNEDIAAKNLDYDQAMKGWYFNAGVVNFNLAKFRENNINLDYYKVNFVDKVKPETKNYMGDQSVLNYCFLFQTKILEEGELCSINSTVKSANENENVKIWHMGFDKSWNFFLEDYKDDFSKENSAQYFAPEPFEKCRLNINNGSLMCHQVWWKYAKNTPYYDEILQAARRKTQKHLLDLIFHYRKTAKELDQFEKPIPPPVG